MTVNNTKSVRSHGRWPVKKLCVGQMIRFHSENYGNQAILTIEKLIRFEKMVLVSGPEMNDVVLGLYDWVELVSIKEMEQNAG